MANEKPEDAERGDAASAAGPGAPGAPSDPPSADASEASADALPDAAAGSRPEVGWRAAGSRDDDVRDDGIRDDGPATDPRGVDDPADRDEPGETAEHAEDDAVDEERGWSFAARALAFLVVLLAGAGLGVWAAPRIAPLLPAGMAPVAAWLTPGASELEARVAALEGRLETELGAVGSRLAAMPDASVLEGRARDLVGAAQDELGGRIEALRQELGAAATGDAGERLGRLETALEGATAELAALKGQIESGAAGLSEDAAQSIDTYRAELDGLRAEVGELAGSVSGLGARLDEARAAADARATAAEAKAAEVQQAAVVERDLSAARADLAAIAAALASGAPFQEPLDRLAETAGVTVPPGLSAAAATGVATPAALRAEFADAAHGAIRASIQAGAGEGLIARSRAFLEAQVASRSLTPQDGADPDAVLSRVEDALRRDDLAAALAEAERLPSEAGDALAGWIAAARARADAEAGLAEVSAAVNPTN
jgi:hypothetical protein